jgi:Flp pilus assembly protein TadG
MHALMRKQRPGQSIVEFALVVPMIFVLLFGVIELGTIFSIYVGLTNTAREAARTGAAFQFQHSDDLVTSPPIATVDAARAAAMDAAILTTLSPLIDASRLNASAARYRYDPQTLPYNNYRYGDRVIVSLSYQHEFFFNLLGRSMTLRAESSMRLEPGGF